MEFNQFVNEVKGGIKQFLPIEYEDAQVRIEEVKKLNENYLGITVLKENQVIAPTFNLNQLYKMYQSDPEISMGSILRSITKLVLDVPNKLKPAIFSFGLVTIGENSVVPDGVQIGKNTAISGVTTREDYPNGILESGETLIKAGERA